MFLKDRHVRRQIQNPLPESLDPQTLDPQSVRFQIRNRLREILDPQTLDLQTLDPQTLDPWVNTGPDPKSVSRDYRPPRPPEIPQIFCLGSFAVRV